MSQPASVDVRGPRLAAWVTSAVPVDALVTDSGSGVAAQAAVSAMGTGVSRTPHVVLLLALVGSAGYLLGAPVVGAVATGAALVAVLLDAATGSCLGRELHLLRRRALPVRTA